MELRHLRYFLAVAESGSVSKAALNQLNVAQPSLSRQLKDLEDEIGVTLFDRSIRGMSLTPSGKLFKTCAQEILKKVDEAVLAVQKMPTTLRVGIIPGLEMEILPVVTEIVGRYSENVHIQVKSSLSKSLIRDLEESALDLAFTRQSHIKNGLHFEPIGSHRLAVFVREHSELSRQACVNFNDLVNQTHISVSHRSAPFLYNSIESWVHDHPEKLTSDYVASSIASVFSLVLATGGFSILPDYAARLMPKSVTMRPIVDGPPPILLTIAHQSLSPSRTHPLIGAILKDWPRVEPSDAGDIHPLRPSADLAASK